MEKATEEWGVLTYCLNNFDRIIKNLKTLWNSPLNISKIFNEFISSLNKLLSDRN